MNQLKKDTLYQRAKEKIKNKGLVYASAAVIAVSTGLVMSGRSCCGDGSPATTPQPMVEAPVRGDGVCHEELEGYPYLLDARTGAIRRDAQNNPMPNPYYSKEDCFRNDGVCDSDPTKVLDSAGRPHQLRDPDGKVVNYVQWRDGRRFNLPLEGETDVDCIMQLVREKGCMPLDTANPVYIDRPRVRDRLIAEPLVERSGDGSKILAYVLPPIWVLRPMEGVNSIFWMHENPQSPEHQRRVAPANNWFLMPFARDEVCPTDEAAKTLQLCTPESVTACICPNLRGCAPPEDACGNGRIDRDRGERCDQRATPSGCPRGQVCAPGCKRCQRAQDPCGNGIIDPGEACDPRATPTGCGSGQRCAPGCRSCASEATHSDCQGSPGSRVCATVPGAGDDLCSSNADCNPAPPPPTPCDGSVLSRLRRAALNSLTNAKAQVRSAVGATAQQSVNATVPVAVSGGTPSVSGSVSLSGPGSGSVGSGLVDLSSVSFTPDVNCTGTVIVTVSGDN